MSKQPDVTITPTDEQDDPRNVQVRYEETKVSYASQFLVNSTAEELVLNMSPGYLSEPNGTVSVLPIHTRVAMTPNSAVRLVQTLTQAINNVRQAQAKARTEAQQAEANRQPQNQGENQNDSK